MLPITSYTKTLTSPQASQLKDLLTAKGYEFSTKPYCLYAASGEKVNIAVYEKGPKIVVQGKGTEEFVQFLLEPEILKVAELGYELQLEEVAQSKGGAFSPHLGIDESGKGDFFGPLVISGVFVDQDTARKLLDIGVMDSKQVGGDAKIEAIAAQMRRMGTLVHETIMISPEKYNALYDKFRNLNRLLAWGHARIIENLLARVPHCPRALSDQFANPRVLQSALQERGRAIILEQRTKAESDPAVAAASIFARERFVRWLREAGDQIGIKLPKGVSAAVKANARALVARDGPDALRLVAKLHFKTTQEIVPPVTS